MAWHQWVNRNQYHTAASLIGIRPMWRICFGLDATDMISWPQISVKNWHGLRPMGQQELVSHFSITYQTHVEDTIQWFAGNWYGFMITNGITFWIIFACVCQFQFLAINRCKNWHGLTPPGQQETVSQWRINYQTHMEDIRYFGGNWYFLDQDWWWFVPKFQPTGVKNWHGLTPPGQQKPVSHFIITYQTHVEDIFWSGCNWYGFMTANGIVFWIRIACAGVCQFLAINCLIKLLWPDTTRPAGASIKVKDHLLNLCGGYPMVWRQLIWFHDCKWDHFLIWILVMICAKISANCCQKLAWPDTTIGLQKLYHNEESHIKQCGAYLLVWRQLIWFHDCKWDHFLNQICWFLPIFRHRNCFKKLPWPDTTRPAGASITVKNHLLNLCGGYPMVWRQLIWFHDCKWDHILNQIFWYVSIFGNQLL
jgi:hypothetical protein